MKRFSVVLLLVTLAACVRPPARVLETFPGLQDELVRQAVSSGTRFENLKGLAKIKFKRAGRTNSFSSAIVLEKPDKLRIDILSPFGATYVRAASDGDTLKLYLVAEGRFFSGSPAPENLARLTQFPIDITRMVDLMLYTLPLIAGEVGPVAVRDERYYLTIQDNDVTQELVFDASKNVNSSRIVREDDTLLSVDYTAFAGRDPFPHHIEIRSPSDAIFLEVHFDSVDLNTPIDPSVFVIKPPENVAVEPFPPREPGSIN